MEKGALEESLVSHSPSSEHSDAKADELSFKIAILPRSRIIPTRDALSIN